MNFLKDSEIFARGQMKSECTKNHITSYGATAAGPSQAHDKCVKWLQLASVQFVYWVWQIHRILNGKIYHVVLKKLPFIWLSYARGPPYQAYSCAVRGGRTLKAAAMSDAFTVMTEATAKRLSRWKAKFFLMSVYWGEPCGPDARRPLTGPLCP